MARPVFCGNLDLDTRQYDLERLFSKYGTISRIDIKSGFAFIYFEDERDAEDAIKQLDNVPFGYNRRRLSVEWSRQVEPVSRSRDRPAGDVKPTRTLFVINFDPMRTKTEDIQRHFEPYGKITNIRIRRNFAFVQYETQEEASAAVKKTDKSMIFDRVLTVEYAFRDDGNERDDSYGGAPDKRRGSPYMRSPSPRYRRDYSPFYDRRPRNPGYDRVMLHRMIGEALATIVTVGTEALVMNAMTGAEALVMAGMIGEEALVMAVTIGEEALVMISTRWS